MTTILRTTLAGLCAATGLSLASCSAPAQGPAPVAPVKESVPFEQAGAESWPVQVTTLVDNLDDPWGMDFLPDGRLLVTEQSGRLQLISPDSFQATPVANVPATIEAGQGGLMDVLVHPEFATNQWVYLSYTVESDGKYSTRVSRARLRDAALHDLEPLFTAQPFYKQKRHFGSRLVLADGYLFITVGDRGNRDLAQSLATHNGKVIRLTESGDVPADNPFIATAGALPEIYSYGHRNPQGMARHPVDGSIWVAEHGPQGGDEVNRVRAGANYGWPLITYGEEYGGGKIGQGSRAEGMEQPIVYWVPSIGTGGIDFYTGDYYPNWRPSLLVSGLRLTRIARLELDGEGLGQETKLLADLGMRIRDVQVGPDGLVYALAAGSRLVRLELAQ